MKGDITHIDVSGRGALKLIVLIGFGFGCYDIAKYGYNRLRAMASGAASNVTQYVPTAQNTDLVV